MQSYTERNARRGGITEDEFLERMKTAGFQVWGTPRPGFMWEFTHPDTPRRLYSMAIRETFSAALARFEGELPQAWPHPDEFWP